MHTKHIAPIVIGILLVGGASFYGGTLYAKSKPGAGGAGRNINFQGQAGQFRGNGQGGAGGGQNRAAFGGATAGEIVSKDDTSMTVKLMDGGSKVVFFSASTTIAKTTDGSKEDLTQGTNVMVIGTPNSDGSVTANTVQIRPAGDRGVMMFRGNTQAPAPAPQP